MPHVLFWLCTVNLNNLQDAEREVYDCSGLPTSSCTRLWTGFPCQPVCCLSKGCNIDSGFWSLNKLAGYMLQHGQTSFHIPLQKTHWGTSGAGQGLPRRAAGTCSSCHSGRGNTTQLSQIWKLWRIYMLQIITFHRKHKYRLSCTHQDCLSIFMHKMSATNFKCCFMRWL